MCWLRIVVLVKLIYWMALLLVTTHSPQALSTIKNTNIRIIDPTKNEAETPVVNPYGRDSIVALEDLMNVSATAIEVIPSPHLIFEYTNLVLSCITSEKLTDVKADSGISCGHAKENKFA